MSRTVSFAATDGFELRGTLFGEPAGARAGLLIVPAMGVPQRFYADFATWLAGQGSVVLCFDCRGIGASRHGPLRDLQADVLTWAEQDTAAALAFLDAQLVPSTPIHWLGHSLGGQILGLVPGRERISRVVTLGCGSGHWLHNVWKLRLTVGWLWFVVVPIALPLAGYFPGRRLRKIGDLPRGVMAQGRRWCLAPDYLLGDGGPERREHYARITMPILWLSFTDDEYMSVRNTASIHGFYAAAPKTLRIGHFGFFRKRFATTLWPEVTHCLALENP